MTALLDNFNRANGGVGANWATVPSVAAAGLTIVSNEVKFESGARASGWLPATYGADGDIEYTLRTVDGSGSAHSYLLAQMPDPAMATFTGYVLDFGFTSGSAMIVTLYRGNAGSFTTLHTSTSVPYATGDVFGFRKVGADITAMKNGVAVSGFPITDTSPLSATGTYIGCGGYGATTLTVDDFSGPSTATTYFGSLSVDLTDSITTSGIRTTFGSSTVAITDTITTGSGVRTTFGSTSTLLLVTVTTTPLAAAVPEPPGSGRFSLPGRGRIDQPDRGRFALTVKG